MRETRGSRTIELDGKQYKVKAVRPAAGSSEHYTADAWVYPKMREVKNGQILDKLARIVLGV